MCVYAFIQIERKKCGRIYMKVTSREGSGIEMVR